MLPHAVRTLTTVGRGIPNLRLVYKNGREIDGGRDASSRSEPSIKPCLAESFELRQDFPSCPCSGPPQCIGKYSTGDLLLSLRMGYVL